MEYLVVVNDADKKRILLKHTLQDPFEPCKIMGYKEFLKKYYFDYQEQAIYEIKKEFNTTQEIAQMYVKNLYLIPNEPIQNEKIEFLKKIKDQIKKENLVDDNSMWKESLKSKTIVFYHIARQDKIYSFIKEDCQKHSKVLEIELTNEKNPNHQAFVLENPTEEIIEIINQIAVLLKKKISPNKIYIANLNDTYRKLLKTYSKIFQIPIETKEPVNLLSTPILSNWLNQPNVDISKIAEQITPNTNDETCKIIKKLVDAWNHYIYIEDEQERKQFMIHKLNTDPTALQEKKQAIREIDFLEEEIKEDSYVFICNATEGNFPKLYKDEEFLSDEERKLLHVSTIKEKNELEKESLLKKLQSTKNVILTYSKTDGKLEKYPSGILEKMKIAITSKTEKEYIHSHTYNQLSLAMYLDEFRKYGIKNKDMDSLLATYPAFPYQSYHNQFQPFPMTIQSLQLSYSSLDHFYRCPFRYYVNHILHLETYEPSTEQKIGTLFHQVLKDYYEENFEFEKSWNLHRNHIKVENPREEFFINKLKKDLKRIILTLKEQEGEKPFQIITEKRIDVPLKEQPEITLTGIIDKIFVKETETETLLSIVDYKTGNPNLSLDNLSYGLNMQLPIYIYLLKKMPYKNPKIIGFYLQKILPSLPKRDFTHTEEQLKQNQLKLQGYSIDQEKLLSQFDPTYENSKLIQSMKKTNNGFYVYAKTFSEEELNSIEKIVEKNLWKYIQQLKQMDFQIKPLRIGKNLIGCEYCSFNEICYRTENDIQNVPEIKWRKKENDDMDERTE